MENKPMQPTDAPNERPVLEAAENMDWRQVFLHGGSPCFHLNVKRKRFCGRAKEWPGHLADEFQDHIYVSLENLLAALASPSSAEHAPAGPLRRMREAVECVRHEGNDLGECWMDCRRCRLEKELAALAATNAQPATPTTDDVWEVVEGTEADDWGITRRGEQGQTVAQMLWEKDAMEIVASHNGAVAIKAASQLEEALRLDDAVAEEAAHSMVVEKVPEKGELRSARGFEEWWDNWILGQKKPYNALTKTDMEICWKSAQREVALAGEPSESAALADQPAATPAQLRSTLERLVSKWEKQAQEYRQRQMFDFAQEAGSYADELKAVLNTHIAADYKLNSPHMGTDFFVSGEPLTDSETQWLKSFRRAAPTEERK